MRRPEPTTYLELRDCLEKLLAPYLGLYSGGQMGLWVEPPRSPPADSAKGVICVIDRDPEPIDSRPAGQQTSLTFFWKVTITNYESSPGDRAGKTAAEVHAIDAAYHLAMDEALATIRRNFPIHKERPSPQDVNSFRRTTFLLKQFRLENPRF